SQSALAPDRYIGLEASFYTAKMKHHGKRSANGPELMEFMRQQAINFGTRVITDDIVKVDLQHHPFTVHSLEGQVVSTLALIMAKWNRVLVEVLGTEEDGVTGAVLRNTLNEETEMLPVSGVFLAIGHTPNTHFLGGQVKLDESGYIVWTRPQRTYTSVEGVFA